MIFHQTLGLKFGAFLQRFAYFRPIEDERVYLYYKATEAFIQ